MDESNIPLPSTPLPTSSEHPMPPAPANLPTAPEPKPMMPLPSSPPVIPKPEPLLPPLAPKPAGIFGISLGKSDDTPAVPPKPAVPPPWTIPHEERVAGPVMMPPKPRPPEPAVADQKLPHNRRASYGALVSIIIILLIVTVGAFYAWGARIAQERATTAVPDTSAQQ